MFNFIVMVLLVPLGAFLAFAAKKPNTFRVQRELNTKASAEQLFSLINDFHKWPSWSPWEKRDAEMKRSYSGPESGVGAVYEWEGNNDVGSGRMEILQSSSPSKVLIKLDFLKPFEGHNTAEFTIAPETDSTKVTWAMYGPCNYQVKVMHCFINMDKMIGKDFEEGLSNMKALVEK